MLNLENITATAHRWLVGLAGIATIAAGVWGIVDKSTLGIPVNDVAYVTTAIGTLLLIVNYLRSMTDPQPSPVAPPAASTSGTNPPAPPA
jgi:hypothetical protein